MDRIRQLFQIGLRDRWFRANLILRVIILIWVSAFGTAMLGDSDYYLTSMRSVWAGEWGGATFRAPLYVWFLATVGGPIVATTLVSLAIWLVGVDLSRRCGRFAAMLWLFDPVLLVLGVAIMSDALFALFVYGSVLTFKAYLQSPTSRNAVRLGVFMGLAVLTRPIGIPFALLVALFALIPFSKTAVKGVVIAGVVALALVIPRLYWNSQQGEGWTVASQGKIFQMTVAAAVEYSGSGINYTASEKRWIDEHPSNPSDPALVRETILRKFSVWLKLSAKGVLRTLFGHVNVEAGTFAVGHPIIGPGWFSEGNPGHPWSTAEKGLWIFGLFFVAIYACVEYVWLARGVFAGFPRLSSWNLWLLLSVAGFVAAPQLFGDCRFRLPIIALLFAARGLVNSDKPQSSVPRSL